MVKMVTVRNPPWWQGIDAVLLAKLQPMRKSRNFNAHVHLNTCSTSNDARFHDTDKLHTPVRCLDATALML